MRAGSVQPLWVQLRVTNAGVDTRSCWGKAFWCCLLGRWAASGAPGGSARGVVVPGVAAGGTVARIGWLLAAASGHGCGVLGPSTASKPRVRGSAGRVCLPLVFVTVKLRDLSLKRLRGGAGIKQVQKYLHSVLHAVNCETPDSFSAVECVSSETTPEGFMV